MRRQVPLMLCFIAGVFTAVQYFIPHPAVQDFQERLLSWLMTLLAFAFLLKSRAFGPQWVLYLFIVVAAAEVAVGS